MNDQHGTRGIASGTWLKANDPRQHNRFLYVCCADAAHTHGLAVRDASIGHGALKDDAKVRVFRVSTDRIHTDGKARRYGYNVVSKVPAWAKAAVKRRLAETG